MTSLEQYLDASDADEEELEAKQDLTVPDTCQWLLEDATFLQWRDRSPHKTAHQIYWLTGDPGSGKSFLAAHVVHDLRERGCDVNFYFLKHGDQSKQQIGGLLKSMTLQTARRSAGLRRSLLALQQEDTRDHFSVENTDIHGIWKQLLVSRMFKGSSDRHQYWVIDALDEANGTGDQFLNLLPKLPKNFSIFITCRPSLDTIKAQRILGDASFVRRITQGDTKQDINLYLQHNADGLPVDKDDPAHLQHLIRNLTRRSQGSFLWTSLIVEELGDCYEGNAIDSTLEGVPAGMYQLYRRMFEKIVRVHKARNVDLARKIMMWVITATRPLRLKELRSALEFETKGSLVQLQRAIENTCSPLLKIANDHVEVVHDTVRDYLFNRDRRSDMAVVSEFALDKGASHEQLAFTCIEYLSAKFHSTQRWSSSGTFNADEPFFGYASKNFAHHVYKSAQAKESSATTKLVAAIIRFLDGPLTSWIQFQASGRTLSPLTDAGKDLKAFAARRLSSVTDLSDLKVQLSDILTWADDLIHLVAVFGKDLVKIPRAIHNVIPPLCPRRSKLHRAYSGSGLQLAGASRDRWPDHISSSSFGNDYTTALACGKTYHAVALRSGQIVLFSANTCQEVRRFDTSSGPAKLLQFVAGKDWIIASSRTHLRLYNSETGDELWTAKVSDEILALSIASDERRVVTVTREQMTKAYELGDGRLASEQPLGRPDGHSRPLQKAYISCEMGLISLLWRNEEVEIYDWPSLRREERHVDHSSHVNTIAFNNVKQHLVLTTFDGALCTIDASTMRKTNEGDGNAAHMTVSPDGKTLVLGDNAGDICIHDFETLELLHRIRSDDGEIIGLSYADNNSRFVDIRRHMCNVWEPAALIRRDEHDDSGSSEGHSTFATALDEPVPGFMSLDKDTSPITAMVSDHKGDFIFCGRENGTVRIYDTSHGRFRQEFHGSGKSMIVLLSWNQHKCLLATADNASTVRIHRITAQQARGATNTQAQWQVIEIAKITLSTSIRQILFSVEADLLLVSATKAAKVYRTDSGSEVFDVPVHSADGAPQKWTTHSDMKRRFLEVTHEDGSVISWGSDISHGLPGLRLGSMKATRIMSNSQRRSPGGAHMIRASDKLWTVYDSDPNAAPLIWSQALSSHKNSASLVAETLEAFGKFATQIIKLVGLYKTSMVYIDVDHWVCSTPIDRPVFDQEPTFHFPVPHYWRSANRHLLVALTTKGDVVFGVGTDVILVRNGLV